ncbi:unnamed protein product [Absidia cylindrospora]
MGFDSAMVFGLAQDLETGEFVAGTVTLLVCGKNMGSIYVGTYRPILDLDVFSYEEITCRQHRTTGFFCRNYHLIIIADSSSSSNNNNDNVAMEVVVPLSSQHYGCFAVPGFYHG